MPNYSRIALNFLAQKSVIYARAVCCLPVRRNINNFRSWVIMLARFVSLYTNKGPEDTNNNQTKLLC